MEREPLAAGWCSNRKANEVAARCLAVCWTPQQCVNMNRCPLAYTICRQFDHLLVKLGKWWGNGWTVQVQAHSGEESPLPLGRGNLSSTQLLGLLKCSWQRQWIQGHCTQPGHTLDGMWNQQPREEDKGNVLPTRKCDDLRFYLILSPDLRASDASEQKPAA